MTSDTTLCGTGEPIRPRKPTPRRFWRLPGVYPPQSDTHLLARTLLVESLEPGTRVLDIGAGTGYLSVSAALAGSRKVTAVDVDRRALLNIRLNARLNGVRVRVVRGDLTIPFGANDFDLVVSNPPYVPAADDVLPVGGLARCWDAGRDGRAYLDRICREAARILSPGGVLLLLQSGLSDIDATWTELRRQGLSTDVVSTEHIPFGPVLTARASLLRQRGLLRPDEDFEKLVVFRAVNSGSAAH
ncbi:HemK2/MTQ2 family protein methyltransferase [Rhodococcus sp. W8901]|uniref:HemK2/MTQ2 family protein methyltransferase n=1 Tax=Rhodococcus sp. W8901 TaxID=2742603 RepID=UPI0015839D60|nr:HemK2/MTQ2 family protein methyltransferase [Rhodococcus sp. W8901]QKT11710.1 methyltransferase [Rhodococcus sp. W8901]